MGIESGDPPFLSAESADGERSRGDPGEQALILRALHADVARRLLQALERSAGITEELRRLQVAMDSPMIAPQAGMRSPRLCVVDDDLDVLDVVVDSLEAAGYEVVGFSDPTKALGACDARAADYDLYVMDVIMPRLDGRRLAERITERRPDARFLFMSGALTDPAIRDWLSCTRAAFIPKPFVPQELVRRVAERVGPPPHSAVFAGA